MKQNSKLQVHVVDNQKKEENSPTRENRPQQLELTVTTGTNNSHNYQMPIMISWSQMGQTTPNLPRKTVDNGTLSLPQYSYTE
jgi:hypothetical protein